MGKVLEYLGPAEEKFILKQKVFFVGTAPLSATGHVNVSPRSPGTSLVVLDKLTIAMADLTGSGSETAAHVMEKYNERITLLFCNIESGPPKLLRIHGTAKVIIKENVPDEMIQKFPSEITTSYGFRAVYVININRISTSCGFSMPVMKFEKYRQVLNEWTTNRGLEGVEDYSLLKNSYSIDGLPSLGLLRFDAQQQQKQQTKMKMKIIPTTEDGYVLGKLVEESKETEEGHNSSSNNKRDLVLNGDGLLDGPSSSHQHQQRRLQWNWLSFSCGIFGGMLMGMALSTQTQSSIHIDL